MGCIFIFVVGTEKHANHELVGLTSFASNQHDVLPMDNALLAEEEKDDTVAHRHDTFLFSPLSSQRDNMSESDMRNTDHVDGLPALRKQGPRRFPCKARGVPSMHNSRNAYIEIPADAVHGANLVCSHPVCAGSGRKFSYCAVCQVPVAKRNFNKRHSHGNEAVPPWEPRDSLIIDRSDDETNKLDVSSNHSSWRDNDTDDSQSNDAGRVSRIHQTSGSSESQRRIYQEGAATGIPDHHTSLMATRNEETAVRTALTENERAWLSLLHARPGPHDPSALDKWFELVLELSEGRQPPHQTSHVLQGPLQASPTRSREATVASNRRDSYSQSSDDLFVNGEYQW